MDRSERALADCSGGRHWHLYIPGRPGTLELNECRRRVSLKVHPRRDGGWASALTTELQRRTPRVHDNPMALAAHEVMVEAERAFRRAHRAHPWRRAAG